MENAGAGTMTDYGKLEWSNIPVPRACDGGCDYEELDKWEDEWPLGRVETRKSDTVAPLRCKKCGQVAIQLRTKKSH